MPVPMKVSGVRGMRAFISRMRSQGSSLWNRTVTAMCVLVVKSMAW